MGELCKTSSLRTLQKKSATRFCVKVYSRLNFSAKWMWSQSNIWHFFPIASIFARFLSRYGLRLCHYLSFWKLCKIWSFLNSHSELRGFFFVLLSFWVPKVVEGSRILTVHYFLVLYRLHSHANSSGNKTYFKLNLIWIKSVSNLSILLPCNSRSKESKVVIRSPRNSVSDPDPGSRIRDEHPRLFFREFRNSYLV